MLNLSNVGIRHNGQTVLQPFDLALNTGQMVAICGPNGAGKSSLLRCIAGLEKPDTGTVTLNGDNIASLGAAHLAKQRSWLAQQTDTSRAFTVEQVIALSGHSAESEHWKDYGLDALRRRPIAELSGGEQQRCQLLRTELQLAASPACWLLDEPTANLDIAWQHRLLARMKTFAQGGNLVIVVLHDVQLAAQYADYALLLGKKQLLASGPIHDVFTTERLSHLYQYPVQVSLARENILRVTTSPQP